MIRKCIGLLAGVLLIVIGFNKWSEHTIHIAVIAPIQTQPGRDIVNGVQLSINQFNESFAKNKIQLHVYDDENNPVKAKQIVDGLSKKISAVIGHLSSDSALACEESYKAQGMPVLLPSATNDTISYMFKMRYDNTLQARYMCLYAKHILKHDNVDVIYSNSVFGLDLKSRLLEQAESIGLKVNNVYSYEESINKEFVSKLQNAKGTSVFLSATNLDDSKTFIELYKNLDVRLIGSDNFTSLHFAKNHDVYSVLPFVYNTKALAYMASNYKQDYQVKPSWYAVYSYDSMQILIDKINQLKSKQIISKSVNHREYLYKQLIEHKHTINKNASLYQQTILKHDDLKNSNKSISFGYNNLGEFITYPIQLLFVENTPVHKQLLIDNNEAIEEVGRFYYKTHAVYTGISLNNVLGMDDTTATLDFYLWLKYPKFLEQANDVVFLNSISTLAVKREYPAEAKEHITLVNEKIVDGDIYQLYRVVGKFQMHSFTPLHRSFYGKTDNFGMSFKNQLLDSKHIRYIHDETEHDIESINGSHAVLHNHGWICTQINSYESLRQSSSLGDTHNPDAYTTVSQMNLQADLKRFGFSMFDLLNYTKAYYLLIIGLIIVSLITFLNNFCGFKFDIIAYLSYTICMFPLQYMIMDYVALSSDLYKYKFTFSVVFDMWWWIFLAKLMSELIHRFVWQKLSRIREVPKLLSMSIDSLLYMFAALCVLAFVLDKPVTSLITSISLLGLLVVTAIKMNVSNVFSGFFLHMEGILRTGDWLKVDGEVLQMMGTNWRSTALQTPEGAIVSIPNTTLSGLKILNYSHPNELYEVKLYVRASINTDPAIIERIIREEIKIDSKVKELKVELDRYDGNFAMYEIGCAVVDYDGDDGEFKDITYRQIWHAFQGAGISMAISPHSNVSVEMTNPVNVSVEMDSSVNIEKDKKSNSKDKKKQ